MEIVEGQTFGGCTGEARTSAEVQDHGSEEAGVSSSMSSRF